MFIGEEPGFAPEEHRMSFLSMFMRIDRRFMGKCFGQMQELGIYPGQIPVLGLLAYKRRIEPARDCRTFENQTADRQCDRPAAGKSRIPFPQSR